jgi:transcriptional regulator with XRE-family HTH domain
MRKRNGWSQEELAEKLDVTRQSVSKWEGAQSLPDLGKVLAMADLFGVTTDTLLKDDIALPDFPGAAETHTGPESAPLRQVSLEEANAYLDTAKECALAIARGTALCILSPIAIILLSVAAENGNLPLTGNQAAAAGTIILLAIVAAAVALFVQSGLRLSRYGYLERERIDTGYGVHGRVLDEKQRYEPTFRLKLVLGIVLNLFAAVPVLVCALFGEGNNLLIAFGVCLLLAFIASGVCLLVQNGIVWNSFSVLLEEGDYVRRNKDPKLERVQSVYWALVTASFLAVSFVTMRWDRTWIVWPVAGVLSVVVTEVARSLIRKSGE